MDERNERSVEHISERATPLVHGIRKVFREHQATNMEAMVALDTIVTQLAQACQDDVVLDAMRKSFNAAIDMGKRTRGMSEADIIATVKEETRLIHEQHQRLLDEMEEKPNGNHESRWN